MPGISHRSKQIKKRPNLVIEEGEEVEELSEQFEDKAPCPLLEKYEKFPEYIEIDLKPQVSKLVTLLTQYNSHTLKKILD